MTLKSFKEFITLDEALITFGGKAYPKFGQVVILAGGAGSGKGFTLSKLLGIEGKVFDVDALKSLVMKSSQLSAKIKKETGYDIKNFDLKKPENVATIHKLLASVYGITKKNEINAYQGILTADNDRKPNLIFDVTLKSMAKLASIARDAEGLGYKKENIHIVWVMNDVNIAIEQNQKRDRIVPKEILLDTHEGAALTMAKVVTMGDDLKQYMDGDIWISFNKMNVDSKIKKSDNGGSFVVKSNYIQVKKKGKRSKSMAELDKNIIKKIVDYAPKTVTWG
ncbi:Zeta toxin domain-containing protein [Morganella phage vB_Mm5]